MEGSKLYVGNLDYALTDQELERLFSSFGTVRSVKIIQGKGFGFVEMSSPEEAERAREKLNDTEFKNRTIKIDEARPPQDNGKKRRPL